MSRERRTKKQSLCDSDQTGKHLTVVEDLCTKY